VAKRWGWGSGEYATSIYCVQHYRLCTLHLAIPPPWGSHLSKAAQDQKTKQNKQTANQDHNMKSICDVPAKKEHNFPSLLLHPSLSNQLSKAPKSGSGESEPESLVLWVVVWSPSRQRCAECPSPVARRKRRNGNEFSGARMKSGDCISPTAEERRVVRSTASSGQSRRRWSEVYGADPHGHSPASIFGGESVGEWLQNTRHNARVSVQSTLCRWSGNLKEGYERGSSVFHRRNNSVRAWVCSQVFVVSANWHGVVDDAPSLASVSACSFPRIPQWEGHHTVEICQPRSWSFSMISCVRRAYSWLCLLK